MTVMPPWEILRRCLVRPSVRWSARTLVQSSLHVRCTEGFVPRSDEPNDAPHWEFHRLVGGRMHCAGRLMSATAKSWSLEVAPASTCTLTLRAISSRPFRPQREQGQSMGGPRPQGVRPTTNPRHARGKRAEQLRALHDPRQGRGPGARGDHRGREPLPARRALLNSRTTRDRCRAPSMSVVVRRWRGVSCSIWRHERAHTTIQKKKKKKKKKKNKKKTGRARSAGSAVSTKGGPSVAQLPRLTLAVVLLVARRGRPRPRVRRSRNARRRHARTTTVRGEVHAERCARSRSPRGETVLDGWAASGPGEPSRSAARPQTIGALQKVGGEGDVVVLDYATSVKDSVARLELRPLRRRPPCHRPPPRLRGRHGARLRLEARPLGLLVRRRIPGLPRPAGLAPQRSLDGAAPPSW